MQRFSNCRAPPAYRTTDLGEEADEANVFIFLGWGGFQLCRKYRVLNRVFVPVHSYQYFVCQTSVLTEEISVVSNILADIFVKLCQIFS